MRRARVAASALGLIGAGLVLVPGLTGANAVPATSAGLTSGSVGVNDLKPSACSGLSLTGLVVGGNGGNLAELVVGTAAGDTIRGNARDDCILGGGGNDSLRGDAGTDVCIGGPGADTFQATCETQIQ